MDTTVSQDDPTGDVSWIASASVIEDASEEFSIKMESSRPLYEVRKFEKYEV